VPLLAVLLVVGVAALMFAWPWLRLASVGGVLGRYAPIRDGEGRLIARYSPDGQPVGWESQNTRVVPGLRLYTDIRRVPSDAIVRAIERKTGATDVTSSGALGDVEIVETRALALGADGEVRQTLVYGYRDADGDYLVGFTDTASDNDVMFDPPSLTLPQSAAVGDRWERAGNLGTLEYRAQGEVVAQAAYDGPAGRFDDCLTVDTALITSRGEQRDEARSREYWCAGVGSVAADSVDPTTGVLVQRSYLVTSHSTAANASAAPPPAPLLANAADGTGQAGADEPVPSVSDPATWTVTRVGRTRASGETSESTIPPLWIPADPPLVLGAGYEGDLVAFDASGAGGLLRWSFHPEGSVYGPPAFDPTTGRIFFGASDKRVYAVDTRGFFLWSYRTSDNVATRPVVSGDLVIVASEDARVYALDAATGAERWRVRTDGPVVSSPALAGDVVLIGSDDQNVYAFDVGTGERRWTYAAGDAVEAPVAATDDGWAFVASRGGTLAALAIESCAETCDPAWTFEADAALRTAPLVLDDRVLVVDEEGVLVAVSRDDGRRLWTDTGRRYVGAPIGVGGSVVATMARGDVVRLSVDGAHEAIWSTNEAVTVNDAESNFAIGPTYGGDSIWLADTNAVLRRIGPPIVGAMPSLRLAWVGNTTRPPFAREHVRWTPLEYGGRLLVLDYGKHVFSVDPASGSAELIATLPGDGGLTQIDPVLAGETLLTVQGRTLQAFDLRSRRLLWEMPSTAASYRPPVVVGNVVLWASAGEADGSLFALDIATGAHRWQADVAGSPRGGVVASRDAAYTNGPPAAYDLATGAQQWRASIQGAPLGGPTLSDDEQTLYIGTYQADTDTGDIVALDASTGAERWRADLGTSVLSPLERPWVAEGVVVVPLINGSVVGLDAATGAERWRFGSTVARLGGLTVDRGRVWFMLESARFFVLDARTGLPLARFADIELSLNGSGLNQRPLVVGRNVVIPASLVMLGFDVPEGTP